MLIGYLFLLPASFFYLTQFVSLVCCMRVCLCVIFFCLSFLVGGYMVLWVTTCDRCLPFFMYVLKYVLQRHITMTTMFRLIDDLCQVKAALIFMANHLRYVPRNFTIDLVFRISHFILRTLCLWRARYINVAVVVFVAAVVVGFFFRSLCLYERFIRHYSSYEVNKKSDLAVIVQKSIRSSAEEGEGRFRERCVCFVTYRQKWRTFYDYDWKLHAQAYILNTLAYLSLWAHFLSLFFLTFCSVACG